MKKTTLIKILIGLVTVLIILVSLSFIDSHHDFEEQLSINKKVDSVMQDDANQRYLHDLTVRNKQIRNSWKDYIKISTNDYNYFDLGGVENLKIICKNDTPYKLDVVYVDVCYIIDDGTCYKTEELTFNNVPPNSEMSLDAPNSPRGKRISVDVLEMYSDELNFLYNLTTALPDGTNDPYFSKVRHR
ncbi:hypothetical protein CLU81_5329 [Flavobacterium sp. 9]|uniref:hypothetical protein n=1 Tax=Flavobacterium sp. 9 TaxID=2035198 RepID=UPI000C17EC0A|nr:hypothetical protein [Flavobacterium sp. 9]PIF34668.1 hypothetical protein CLU81_5329 [Flavobacterium sp. 9]